MQQRDVRVVRPHQADAVVVVASSRSLRGSLRARSKRQFPWIGREIPALQFQKRLGHLLPRNAEAEPVHRAPKPRVHRPLPMRLRVLTALHEVKFVLRAVTQRLGRPLLGEPLADYPLRETFSPSRPLPLRSFPRRASRTHPSRLLRHGHRVCLLRRELIEDAVGGGEQRGPAHERGVVSVDAHPRRRRGDPLGRREAGSLHRP